jgi:threonyl-tRNA synthetase
MSIAPSKKQDQEYLNKLRHSAAHLLAAAVLELKPDAKPTIGPSIDDGFYYDFDFQDNPISENDLPTLEQKMRELVKKWQGFERIEVDKDAALNKFNSNAYKHELIEEFSAEGKALTMYKSGEFTDLCRGGHVDNPSKELKHFKLMSIAGAYWRGSEKNKMLTRIYGTAWKSKEDLDNYLRLLEEAKKRDHRKLGKELDLFTFSELIGAGFPLYTPRGAFIRLAVNQYVESVQSKQGYDQVWTPQVAKAELFKKSGHYDKYKDDMFLVKSHYSKEEFFLKPMNCPQHTQIYASKPRSYRDLPIRMTDFAMLYRDEKPGELSGLARVRSFSQDDCHIFCREDQVDFEVDQALTMIKQIMNTFGFSYRYRLSTRDPKTPEKYLGDPKTWDRLEAWAVQIMERNNIEYFEGPGEAAFYGPKMDLMATDALGREWQLSTVQIDMVQPARFGLEYIDSDGKPKQPVMIHRAIVGSPERFLMILLEHFAGAFPLWLSPTQVTIIPVNEVHGDASQKIHKALLDAGIRSELNSDNASLGKRIRIAEKHKVPFMVVIGDKETAENSVNVRRRGQKEQESMPLADFITHAKMLIDSRSLAL